MTPPAASGGRHRPAAHHAAPASATTRLLRVTATGDRLGDRLAALGGASLRLRALALPATLAALRPGWRPADPTAAAGIAWTRLDEACARAEAARPLAGPDAAGRGGRRQPAWARPGGRGRAAPPVVAGLPAAGAAAAPAPGASAGSAPSPARAALPGTAGWPSPPAPWLPVDGSDRGRRLPAAPAALVPGGTAAGGRAVGSADDAPPRLAPASGWTAAVDPAAAPAALGGSAPARPAPGGGDRPDRTAVDASSRRAPTGTAASSPAAAPDAADLGAVPGPALGAGALGELLRRWEQPAGDDQPPAGRDVPPDPFPVPAVRGDGWPAAAPGHDQAPSWPGGGDLATGQVAAPGTSWAALDVELLLDRVEWAVDELLRREAEAHGLDGAGQVQP